MLSTLLHSNFIHLIIQSVNYFIMVYSVYVLHPKYSEAKVFVRGLCVEWVNNNEHPQNLSLNLIPT